MRNWGGRRGRWQRHRLRKHCAFLDRMDIHTFGFRDATQILNSTVIPRPIAFVSTLSAENRPNLAPFRYGMRLVRTTICLPLFLSITLFDSFFQVASDEKAAP